MYSVSVVDKALDAIMAGYSVAEIRPIIGELPPGERQILLCTVCALHNEIASNCQQHAKEVSKLLTLACPLYIDGIATCLFDGFSRFSIQPQPPSVQR